MSTGTTARLAPRTRPGAQILHLHGQAKSWEHCAVLSEAQDIERAYRITGGRCAAIRAKVDPPVFAPLPAYGTRLRGIRFAEGDSPSRLVIKLLNELAGTRRAYLLSLDTPDALRGVIERLADIARRAGKGGRHLVRGLMAQIADAPLRLVEYLVRTAVQALVAPRTYGLTRLRLLDPGKLLI